MDSDPPPDSSAFDDLWDSLVEGPGGSVVKADEPPPAAKASDVVPAGPAGGDDDERDTLLPPGPPGDYVQTMMALGELDDPGFVPGPPRVPSQPEDLHVTPPARPAGRVNALGLVLAPEHELLLEQEPPQRRAPPPLRPQPLPMPPAPRKRSTGKFPAVQGPPPPPFARAVAVGDRVAAHLPIPRAPSVPPVSLDPEDTVETSYEALYAASKPSPQPDAFDSLDALDAFDSLPLQDLAPPVEEFRRATPAALSVPSSSKPIPKPAAQPETPRPPAPLAVGLRLGGKRTQPPMAVQSSPISEAPRSPPRSVREPAPVSEPAPSSLAGRAREMMSLFEARNFSSALVLAESVLLSDPSHAQAKRCAESCRDMLTEKYLGSLGGRASIPRVTMGAEEVRWLSLDHRSGFLLSFIDGSMSIEEVLDVSSMPELDALRIMFELRMQGVIEIDEPSQRPGRR